MKKLILLFSIITSFLFVSCNSIYNNHHRTTKLIINLPAVHASETSRQIYKDEDLSSLNYDETFFEAEFEITIYKPDNSNSQTYQTEKGQSTLVIPDITPGKWCISCSASLPGFEKFAFDKKEEIILKAGDIKTIDLSLSKNVLSKINDVILKSPIANKKYELGSTINPTGTVFTCILSNGYAFDYTPDQLSKLYNTTTTIGFRKHNQDNDSELDFSDAEIYPSAERYCYSIEYRINGLTENTISIIKENSAIITAKKPVITVQPVSTYLLGPVNQFTLNVQVNNDDSDLGEISYKWEETDNFGVYYDTKVNISSSSDSTESLSATVSNLGYIAENKTLPYKTYRCKITNTDNAGGLKETTATTYSNLAIVEFWNPTRSSAINQAFVIKNVIPVVNDSLVIINDYTNINPEASWFKFQKQVRPFSNDVAAAYQAQNDVYVVYPDYESYYISATPVYYENAVSDPNSKYYYGYVPYNVTYQYVYYKPGPYTNNDSTISYESDAVTSEQKNKIVYVKTKLAYIYPRNFSLVSISNDNEYNERFCTKNSDGTYSWYYKDASGQKNEYTSGNNKPELFHVQANSVSFAGYYWDTSYIKKSITKSTFTVHKKLNGNVLPPITLNADVDRTNKNYTNIRYALTEEEIEQISNGATLEVYLECRTEVESDYTSWFVNTDPVIEKTNTIVFKKHE